MSDNSSAGPLERLVGRHTPGPWRVHDAQDFISGLTVRAGPNKSNRIAFIGMPIDENRHKAFYSPEQEGNASLIAAAPDLLEALQYAVRQVPELATVPGIDAALAKALGVPPNANCTSQR